LVCTVCTRNFRIQGLLERIQGSLDRRLPSVQRALYSFLTLATESRAHLIENSLFDRQNVTLFSLVWIHAHRRGTRCAMTIDRSLEAHYMPRLTECGAHRLTECGAHSA